MKKTLLIVCLMLFSVVLVYGTAGAVSGVCSNCHTMHNSQDGDAVVLDGDGNTVATPNERLLKAGCVSCHTAPTNSASRTDFGPAVLHTGSAPSMGVSGTNAGGDFYWVNAGSDSLGHNVIDLPGDSGSDAALGYAPPGWDSSEGSITTAFSSSNQLSCAGEVGCHGTHATGEDKWDGIKGAHHGNTGTGMTASTVGNSFRFLDGIQGVEHTNWEWTATAGNHNEYQGVNDQSDRAYNDDGSYPGSVGARGTMSALCAQCHGIFHQDIGNDSAMVAADPWRRHPTDIALPEAEEYSAYNPTSAYSLEAPVAWVNPETPIRAEAVVMCLSCHRAHGSDQPDLLRWNYDDMTAGSAGAAEGTGCFTCHTTKD